MFPTNFFLPALSLLRAGHSISRHYLYSPQAIKKPARPAGFLNNIDN